MRGPILMDCANGDPSYWMMRCCDCHHETRKPYVKKAKKEKVSK